MRGVEPVAVGGMEKNIRNCFKIFGLLSIVLNLLTYAEVVKTRTRWVQVVRVID